MNRKHIQRAIALGAFCLIDIIAFLLLRQPAVLSA